MNLKGLVGVIRKEKSTLPVSGWQIDFNRNIVYMQSSEREMAAAGLLPAEGDKVEVRCDGLQHIFYGQAVVNKIVHCKASKMQRKDDIAPDVGVLLEFESGCYGPYHVCECMALARNGHSVFFDLLMLSEMERLVSSGDVRFLQV